MPIWLVLPVTVGFILFSHVYLARFTYYMLLVSSMVLMLPSLDKWDNSLYVTPVTLTAILTLLSKRNYSERGVEARASTLYTSLTFVFGGLILYVLEILIPTIGVITDQVLELVLLLIFPFSVRAWVKS